MPPRILAPLVGEPLAIDLANTRLAPARPGREVGADPFGDIDGLQDWLEVESDRLPHVTVTERSRLAVIALRGHVGAALDALAGGAEPPPDSLAALNAALSRAPSHLQLRWEQDAARIERVRAGADEERLVTALAEAAAEYLASDLVSRTRHCEAPDCDLLFAATHPRRRWCSPTVCGNRTRVARYYGKHKPAQVTTP